MTENNIGVLFEKWHNVKKSIHQSKRKLGIKPREIFWVKIGQNIGDEEYGKGEVFSRPVIVVRQLTHDLFIGVPTTTTIKDNDYFQSFTFETKKGTSHNSAMLLQVRTFSKKRVTSKLGKMNSEDFEKLQKNLINLIVPT
jgi:mRNA interferase MazF